MNEEVDGKQVQKVIEMDRILKRRAGEMIDRGLRIAMSWFM